MSGESVKKLMKPLVMLRKPVPHALNVQLVPKVQLAPKVQPVPNVKLRMIDLCAGTGAFSWAFTKYPHVKCVYANDFVSESEAIYNLNHETPLVNKDLLKVKMEEIPDHDLLTAGFSCQPFSISGLQKGFNDERSNVFWKILEILKVKKPRFFVLENVKNLQTHDKGQTFKIIMDNLTQAGYLVKCKVVNTAAISQIPQHRERIYLIGFRQAVDHQNFNFDFPTVANKAIKDCLEAQIHYNEQLKVYPTIKEAVTKNVDQNTVYQYRRFYVRENKSNVCPTLTANMGGGGHNVPLILDDHGIRKLTPRECFNLQGFPADYKLPPELSDSRLYKLAGNAVSVPVVELIAQKLTDLL